MNKDELMKLEKNEIIELLLAIIQQQAEEIKELKARLNQNNKNSSKPPSSDGLKKPPVSLRKPSGKKAGGQMGHDGSGLKVTGEPNSHISHEPDECAVCARAAECDASRIVRETRYEIDINIETSTTAHQIMTVKCPRSEELLTGRFPGNVTGTVQYGTNIEALAVSLNTIGMVSINRTHEILSDVFGVPISTGTITAMASDCAGKVAETANEIKEAIMEEPVMHSDETGLRVGGKTAWAHTASTENLTYIEVHESRGKRGMDAIGILLMFLGTLIHDCYATYFSYDTIRHGLCNAHLLRELIAAKEDAGQGWAQDLIDLLLMMKGTKEKLISSGQLKPSKYYTDKFSRAYDRILAAALAQNPLPEHDGTKKGKPKRGKTRALIDRLHRHKDKFLLFFHDFNVPFDNNQAERDIRMIKVKQKVSGCFRTMEGANEFTAIMSYIGTARKHGLSSFMAIKDALMGNPFSVKSLVTMS